MKFSSLFQYSFNLFFRSMRCLSIFEWSIFFLGGFFFLFIYNTILPQIPLVMFSDFFVFLSCLILWVQLIINNYNSTFFTSNQNIKKYFLMNSVPQNIYKFKLEISQTSKLISLISLLFNLVSLIYFVLFSKTVFVCALGSIKISLSSVIFKCFLSFFLFVLILWTSQQSQILSDEHYIYMFFIYISSSLIITSNNLITLFISFEWLSLLFIILSASVSKSMSFNSYSIISRYFIISSFASILILISTAFIFMYFGTFSFDAIKAVNISANPYTITFLPTFSHNTIVFFFTVGFFIKIGIFPFHIWIMDVYNFISSSFLLVLISFSKISYFFAFNTLISLFYLPANVNLIFSIVSLLTMLVGSVLAVNQKSVKKILISLSIFNSGFVFFTQSIYVFSNSIFFSYLLLESMIFFLLVIFLTMFSSYNSHINPYKYRKIIYITDLSRILPTTAKFIISLMLLTLSGLPPFGLFILKFKILISYALSSTSYLFTLFIILFLFIMMVNSANYIRLIKYLLFSNKSKFYEVQTTVSTENVFFSCFPNFSLQCYSFSLLFIIIWISIVIFFAFELSLISILFEIDSFFL